MILLKKHYLIFIFSLIVIQLQAQNFSSNINPQEENELLKDRATWKEDASKREVYSSTYHTPDGRIIMHHSIQPLNYYNKNGILVPVDFQPKISTKGWTATQQPNVVSVLKNGSVKINYNNDDAIIYSKNTKINGTPVVADEIIKKEDELIMLTGIPGVSKTFEFRFNGLKYNYLLQSTPVFSTPNYIIEEEIELPKNAVVITDENLGKKSAEGWKGSLKVVAENGSDLGTIRGAFCYDGNNNSITASYQLKKINGKQIVRIVIPGAWIKDASRVFPITIDPYVVGPTAALAPSHPKVPSCVAPASGSDSLLVTIPAQITVTGLIVTGSYYADPFANAIMADGSMFFRTSCNSTQTYTVSGPTGQSAGTGYLSLANLNNPLLCCFPQSCSIQTFYLSMHISRTAGGPGCNTNYIYHDPFGPYPFSAYVEGHTVEGFGPTVNLTPTSICSNECSLNLATYVRYGVPPFTITHPWMAGSITSGNASGCSTASTINNLPLSVPNCPWTCDTISSLSVPPPVVTDVCGNTIQNIPSSVLTVKEVPEVIASPNPITICSGETFSTTLTPCLATSVISWSGNSNSGTGTSISETLINNGTAVSTTNYQVSALNNTCQSDTITVVVNTVPHPIAGFSSSPQTVIINTPVTFTDNTAFFGGNIASWSWTFGDGTFDFTQSPTHSFLEVGTYTICLATQTVEGCVDTICQDIVVIPAELVLPNVVTPNGDNMNDALYFDNLEYFGTNNLEVYNRWGKIVYEKTNYTNDWIPKELSDGTYYYLLTLQNGENYKSFLEVLRK